MSMDTNRIYLSHFVAVNQAGYAKVIKTRQLAKMSDAMSNVEIGFRKSWFVSAGD
ncbi:MAG: hypothetical protein IPP22_09465 [Nitrosomonas sp.]|nr:hypothetical protein [Nitrosomonas sp.]